MNKNYKTRNALITGIQQRETASGIYYVIEFRKQDGNVGIFDPWIPILKSPDDLVGMYLQTNYNGYTVTATSEPVAD